LPALAQVPSNRPIVLVSAQPVPGVWPVQYDIRAVTSNGEIFENPEGRMTKVGNLYLTPDEHVIKVFKYKNTLPAEFKAIVWNSSSQQVIELEPGYTESDFIIASRTGKRRSIGNAGLMDGDSVLAVSEVRGVWPAQYEFVVRDDAGQIFATGWDEENSVSRRQAGPFSIHSDDSVILVTRISGVYPTQYELLVRSSDNKIYELDTVKKQASEEGRTLVGRFNLKESDHIISAMADKRTLPITYTLIVSDQKGKVFELSPTSASDNSQVFSNSRRAVGSLSSWQVQNKQPHIVGPASEVCNFLTQDK